MIAIRYTDSRSICRIIYPLRISLSFVISSSKVSASDILEHVRNLQSERYREDCTLTFGTFSNFRHLKKINHLQNVRRLDSVNNSII